MLSQIKPLNHEERQNVRAASHQAVTRTVSERPLRESFDWHTASRYPPSVTKLINRLCIALVGNAQVALPGHMDSPFAWLEAIAPSLLMLSTAHVLKEQLLDSINMRHANERAYQETVNLWLSATADSESHPHWMQFYANALRDAIRKANSRRKDMLESVTTAD